MTKPAKNPTNSLSSFVPADRDVACLETMRWLEPWTSSALSAYSEEGEEACGWLRRLSEAMIVQALGDLHMSEGWSDGLRINENAARRMRIHAKVWFSSDSHVAMSFAQCAETLGLDPAATREAIFAMDKRKVDEIVSKYRRTRI